MSRPALPPRRPTATPSDNEEEEYKPMGIAARIASMQLDHIGRTTPSAPTHRAPIRQTPPAPPPRKTQTVSTSPTCKPTQKELVARGEDYLRLISRKPPPPPTKNKNAPAPPARRLPPMPTRLPTPPPEPEEEEPEEKETCLKCHDFSIVDGHAAQFPRHTVDSLDQLTYDLTAPWESETEKFRAIFTWLHHNISYDCESFFSGNLQPSTPDSVLRTGLAVCEGYAGLFVGLCERAGLQAQKVSGHGKGFGYVATDPGAPLPEFKSNHAWNCVSMDGQWHLIDSCWGAGAVTNQGTFSNRFDPGWFTSSPREFGRRHFPTDPSYQLVAPEDGGPLSWEEYILESPGPDVAQDCHKMGFDAYTVQPAEKYIQSGQWVYFQISKLCQHMSRAQQDNWVYIIYLSDGTRIPLELNQEGDWCANVFIPKGPGPVHLCPVMTLDDREAKGISVDEFKRSIGRKAMSFGGILLWEAV